jgi:hypothetical protein
MTITCFNLVVNVTEENFDPGIYKLRSYCPVANPIGQIIFLYMIQFALRKRESSKVELEHKIVHLSLLHVLY